MLPDQLLGFLIISVLFILMPGPNVLVIVSTSLAAGKARGLQTVAGTSCAMTIQLLIAALGTSSLLTLLNQGLIWLKWLGVCYLLFLGLKALYHCWRRTPAVSVSALGSFRRGFLVSLTNPKTILFFSAFLPQFVSDADMYLQQIAILSVCFLLLAIVIDVGYALLASRANWLVTGRYERAQSIQNGLSGTLYLIASAFLAQSNRA